MRTSLSGLERYIVTVKTSKHRWFTFVESNVVPDSKLIAFAFDDAFYLGVRYQGCKVRIVEREMYNVERGRTSNIQHQSEKWINRSG